MKPPVPPEAPMPPSSGALPSTAPDLVLAPLVGQRLGRSLRSVYRFRELVALLVSRDLKVRYKRSALGMLWSLLNPLLQMAVYSFVFSVIMKVGIAAYPIFLLAGLLPWTLFSTSVSMAAGCLIANASLIRKVAVPQAVYPLALVGSKLVDLLLSIVPLTLIAIWLGRPPSLSWLFLPVAILAVVAFSVGVSLAISSLTVFFRDIKHLIDILLQVWFYLTPVLYTYESIGHLGNRWVTLALRINPAAPIVRCFQICLYEGRFPDPATTGAALLWAFGTLFLGYLLFLRDEPRHILYL
jgi:ABC-type polysaccharide/polyol phosphate export permease